MTESRFPPTMDRREDAGWAKKYATPMAGRSLTSTQERKSRTPAPPMFSPRTRRAASPSCRSCSAENADTKRHARCAPMAAPVPAPCHLIALLPIFERPPYGPSSSNNPTQLTSLSVRKLAHGYRLTNSATSASGTATIAHLSTRKESRSQASFASPRPLPVLDRMRPARRRYQKIHRWPGSSRTPIKLSKRRQTPSMKRKRYLSCRSSPSRAPCRWAPAMAVCLRLETLLAAEVVDFPNHRSEITTGTSG